MLASSPAARADRNRLGSWLVGLWLAVHAVQTLRSVVPLPEPWAGKLPWGMFSHVYARDDRLEYVAVLSDGRRRVLNIADYFGYTRGFTQLRVPDYAKAMTKPWRQAKPGSSADRARAEFARWLAKPLLEMGVDVDSVEIARVTQRHRDGRIRRRELGRWPVGEVMR